MNKKKLKKVKLFECILLGIAVYALSYLPLSFFGHYEPGPRGTNGIKWYEWAPYGASCDYKKINFYIIVFYLPLYVIDRRFRHTDDDAWNDKTLFP